MSLFFHCLVEMFKGNAGFKKLEGIFPLTTQKVKVSVFHLRAITPDLMSP